jgi:MarC family membrane protein
MPMFVNYAGRERAGVQRFVALLISLTVFGLLVLFLVTGTSLLKFFGISLDSFRIAGGVLLLLIGINLVMADAATAGKKAEASTPLSDWQQATSVYRAIVIPLAIPLLVGPGVIANVILYASEAEKQEGKGLFIGLVLVCAAISLLNFIIFVSGRWLRRVLGDIGLSIATRILGLLVAAMGVQFMVTGVTNVIVHSVAPQLSPNKAGAKSPEEGSSKIHTDGRDQDSLRRQPQEVQPLVHSSSDPTDIVERLAEVDVVDRSVKLRTDQIQTVGRSLSTFPPGSVHLNGRLLAQGIARPIWSRKLENSHGRHNDSPSLV